MSLMIPFVFENHDAIFIRRVFHELDIGMVDRVDYVKLKNKDKIYTAYVHLRYWYYSENGDFIFNIVNDKNYNYHTQNDVNNDITIFLNYFENTNRYWLVKKMLCAKISNKVMNKYVNTYKLHSLTKLHTTIDVLQNEIQEKNGIIESSKKTIAKLERCITCMLTGKIGTILSINNNTNSKLTDLERLLLTDSQKNYDNTHRQNTHKRFM